MKIGVHHVPLERALGGGARFQESVIRGLAQTRSSQRHEWTLLTEDESEELGLSIVRLPTRRAGRLQRWRDRWLHRDPTDNELVAFLQSQGIDMIYSPHNNVLTQAIPYVVTCWDLQHRVQPFFPEVSTLGWKWQDRESHYRRILPRASAVVTGTVRGGDEVKRFYGVADERIEIIPFFFPDVLQSKVAKKPDWHVLQPYVVYPAQFWPHKNHVTLVRALAELKSDQGIEMTGVFPGSPGNPDCSTVAHVRMLADELGVKVLMPGFVDDAELRWLIENAVAMVFPTFFGPDNLPPLEAMRLGCPVIASDVAGAAEQLGEAAIRVRADDATAMGNAIGRLFLQPSVRDRLVEDGSSLVRRRTVANYIGALDSLFDRLAGFRGSWPLASSGIT